MLVGFTRRWRVKSARSATVHLVILRAFYTEFYVCEPAYGDYRTIVVNRKHRKFKSAENPNLVRKYG